MGCANTFYPLHIYKDKQKYCKANTNKGFSNKGDQNYNYVAFYRDYRAISLFN